MLISHHLHKIVELIGSHATVSIVASTGSGKSVGIPAAIASAGAKCFVVVPTRTAAISLAEYQRVLQQASNPNADVSKLVGYAAEGSVNYGPETTIAYVTGGHARRKMLSYFSQGTVSPIDFCDVIFADEAHSGSLDITLIISLWMAAASVHVRLPRLVIASATPTPLIIHPTPQVYTVQSSTYPIEFRYLTQELRASIGWKEEGESEEDAIAPQLYLATAELTALIHKENDIDTGHILVFAPGASEVEIIVGRLRELVKEKADIIAAFGALRQEDIAMIYRQTAVNERKIIVATNIAELSITIEDVGYVVDTLIEKRAESSQSGGFRLTTSYVSKDSATQRAGRTGRTRSGVCYRMSSLQRYERLEEHRPPEIDRVPIYGTVMELLDVGLDPVSVMGDIGAERLSRAIRLLVDLGMVKMESGNDSLSVTVTGMGHFAPNFPISVRNAAFLWRWIEAGHPIFPGIVVAALVDCYGPSYFWIPRRQPEQSSNQYDLIVKEHKEKYFTKYLGYSDVETSLNMWNDLTSAIGGIRGDYQAWARENSINQKKVRELLLIVEQSINAALRLGYDVRIGPFTTQGVTQAARQILLLVYADTTLVCREDYRGRKYLDPMSREEYKLDNRYAINQFSSRPPSAIIALVTAEIKGARGTSRVVSFGLDSERNDTDQNRFSLSRRGQRVLVKARRKPVNVSLSDVSPVNQALELLSQLKIGEEGS